MQTASRLLASTAVAIVLASPAYAQSVNQNTFTITDVVGVPTVSGTAVSSTINNNMTANSLGTIITSVGSQAGTNQVNAVGATNPLFLSDSYAINQAAGGGFTYSGPNNGGPSVSGAPIVGTVDQTTTNTIGATSGSNAISSALAGGNQSAINNTNSAFFAPAIGGAGSLTQAGGSITSTTSNSITATVNNGNTFVQGSNGTAPGFQTAITTLNTATLQQGAGLTAAPSTTPTSTLTLDQKVFSGTTLGATNAAIANSIASLPSLDPSVSNLNQSATIGANQLSLASASFTSDSTTTLVPSQVSLLGGQNLNAGTPGALGLTLGNTAMSFSGTLAAGGPSVSATADGIARVSGVTQSATLGLNNVIGGAATSIDFANMEAPSTGFVQSASFVTSPYTIAVPTVNSGGVGGITGTGTAGTINLAAAVTRTGNSSITGSPTDLTQSFRIDTNTIATGGSATGIVTQTASNLSPNADPLQNLASAISENGISSMTNVSQLGSQNVNSFAAGGGAINLALNQTSSDLTLGNLNTQTATGSLNSNITGAAQLGNLSLNVASVGTALNSGLGTSHLTQQAGNTTFTNSNTLTAGATTGNAFNASVNGSQQSTSAINLVR